MTIKKIELGWITVANLKKSKNFFTDMGLKLVESQEEWGWMELQGTEGGTLLGVGEASEKNSNKPGHNAVLTFTVDDLVKSKKEMEAKGVKFVDEIMEVPGDVKMVTFVDPDGNNFQLVERLK